MKSGRKSKRSEKSAKSAKRTFFFNFSSSMSLPVMFFSFIRCFQQEVSESSESSIELVKKSDKSLISDAVASEAPSTTTQIILTKSERFRQSFKDFDVI